MTQSTASHTVTACLVIIGNEILSGRTQDANLRYLAKGLNECGVQLREVRVIPDVEATIVATINEVRAAFDYVLTTGGIGPTHDDITAQSLARAFGVPLVLDAEARRRLEQRIGADRMNEARLRMAHVPQGATLVDNALSSAPGFRIGNVFVLAGVPAVAQSMFDAVRPQLAGGSKVEARTVICNLAEGALATDLGLIQERFPSLDIGSYPAWSSDGFRVSLVLRGTDPALLAEAEAAIIAMVAALGGKLLTDETAA